MLVLKYAEALRLPAGRIRVPAFFLSHEALLLLGLLGLFLFLVLSSDSFRGAQNLKNLTFPITTLGIVSIGVAFGLISGVIDLSVGAIMGVSGVIIGGLISVSGLPFPLALLVVLVSGMLLGLINGLLVIGLRVPSFIITLGTMALFRVGTFRIQYEFFGTAQSIHMLPNDALNWFGRGDTLGAVPVAFYFCIGLALLSYYVLAHSKLGLWFVAVGGNERSAYDAGVSPGRIRILAFVISGFCAALAGAAMTARFQGSLPSVGLGFEFEAITAALIGGASLFGGYGSVIGTVLAVLLLKVVFNGFTHLSVPLGDQFLVRAGIFIVVLWVDANLRQRGRGRSLTGG